ncbi:hypothetical protein HD806DRAFT_460789 [Xylariaceae sp. AK1471]|nr:hypothetical protein HD806DRAFT_460789 [Xylariaceae sp. AK1471]
MTIADTSITNDHDGSSIRFCNLCNKPIASESAFKRHVAYCRRTLGKPKKRKRSCKQCHHAKAKCSFEPQCSRCKSKGLVCEYERPLATPASNETYNGLQEISTSEPSESSPGDTVDSPSRAYTSMADFEGIVTIIELQNMSPPRLATELRADPTQQASVLFLLEIIRGLCHQMSRRETFPVFVHGHWHQRELPDTWVNCMRISQLYIARDVSPHGRELYYSALAEEITRLTRQMSTATKQELLASLEAQIIYTLLGVLDDDTTEANYIPEMRVQKSDLDRTTHLARQLFQTDAYAPFDIDSIGDPNETWEEFIYAESRRRYGAFQMCALFWFIVSRVIDLRSGLKCPPVLGYRGLALPAPETLWSARKREDWEAARAEIQQYRQQPLYNTTLRTFGDLIDSRSCAFNPDCGRQISTWLASCDKLGLMLLVASNMV